MTGLSQDSHMFVNWNTGMLQDRKSLETQTCDRLMNTLFFCKGIQEISCILLYHDIFIILYHHLKILVSPNTRTRTRTYTHTHTQTHTDTHIHRHTHTQTHKHTDTDTHTHRHNTYAHAYKHTHKHTHRHTHRHTQTHKYTYLLWRIEATVWFWLPTLSECFLSTPYWDNISDDDKIFILIYIN